MRLPLFLLLLLIATTAGAQELFSKDDDRPFHAGLNLGINFCQVDGDGFVGYHKVGVVGGAFVYVRLLPILHASLGLGYTQKGSRELGVYKLDLSYAEMPLLFHLFPGGRFHYSAGISYARLISSKEQALDAGGIVINPDLYPFQKQDWSGIGGVSFHISRQWFLSGQYQYTLAGIRNLADIPPGYGYASERNNVVSLRLMYIIPSGAQR